MTKLAEAFIEALNLLVEVNPFVNAMLFVLWFFSLQGSISSMIIRLVFVGATTFLIDCFEIIRLTA